MWTSRSIKTAESPPVLFESYVHCLALARLVTHNLQFHVKINFNPSSSLQTFIFPSAEYCSRSREVSGYQDTGGDMLTVYSVTVVSRVEVLLDEVPRPEVYQRHLVRDQVHQNILWLDISGT